MVLHLFFLRAYLKLGFVIDSPTENTQSPHIQNSLPLISTPAPALKLDSTIRKQQVPVQKGLTSYIMDRVLELCELKKKLSYMEIESFMPTELNAVSNCLIF